MVMEDMEAHRGEKITDYSHAKSFRIPPLSLFSFIYKQKKKKKKHLDCAHVCFSHI